MHAVAAFIELGVVAALHAPPLDERARGPGGRYDPRPPAWGRLLLAAPSSHGGRVGQPALIGTERPSKEVRG